MQRGILKLGSICGLILVVVGCNGSGGSDSGGGAGATANNACVFTPPPADFGGLSAGVVNLIAGNLSGLRKTNSGELVTTYNTSFADYFSLAWNGTTWTSKEIDPGLSFSSTSGSPAIFDYNNQLQFLMTGGGASLPYGTRLFQENSTGYAAPVSVSGFLSFGVTNNIIHANDSTGFAGYATETIGLSNSLTYVGNTVAGDFTTWSRQTIKSSPTDGYVGLASGFLTDNTPYVVSWTASASTSTISLYRRTGVTWTDQVDAYVLTTAGGKMMENVEAKEIPGHKVLVTWGEYNPTVGSVPQHIVARALWIDLAAYTASAPVDLLSVSSLSFSNEVRVRADVSSDGSTGAFMVNDFAQGLIWLGSLTGQTASAAEPYRPDLAFTNFGGATLMYVNCDQLVLFASSTTTPMIIDPLTPNKYDGIIGD